MELHVKLKVRNERKETVVEGFGAGKMETQPVLHPKTMLRRR
jgi:hypothetical protein